MRDNSWRDQDVPVDDGLLMGALDQMKRAAAYGGMSPVLVLSHAANVQESVSMLALALELARARGLDADASSNEGK